MTSMIHKLEFMSASAAHKSDKTKLICTLGTLNQEFNFILFYFF